MKCKVLWIVGIGALVLVLIMGVARRIEIHNRDTDPNWQIAEEIYQVGNTLKEVDDSYVCQSVSKVTPFTYTDSEGNTIVYYCCQTAYITDQPGEHSGLNMDAIGLVVDLTQIESRRECTVNAYDAFQCEIGDRAYLCWTLSPEISCVIEYRVDFVDETDIWKMAKSVHLPANEEK